MVEEDVEVPQTPRGYEPATRDTWRHNMGRFATWKWVKNGKKISDDTSN
jgi:hypothetical protein